MFKKTPLAGAISSLSIASALVAAGISAPIYAQDSAGTIEEVIVTGSRIKRANLESANPVTVIDQADINITGITDVGDLLQRLPSMAGSPIGTTTNNGGDGSVQIDLRGLGPIRTLTLVNGKRTVDGGDYQTIPAAMIERVEILKDGGSAIYGADAVAGVVNIITRKNFEGFEIDVLTSDNFDMDSGAQDSFSFITGKNFADGNFMFGGEFVDQEEAYQSDAPWDFFQDSYFIYPGGCENQLTAPYDGTPQGGCYIVGSSRIPEGRLQSGELQQRFNSDGTPRLFDWFNGVPNGHDDYDSTYGVLSFNNPVFMNAGTGNGIESYDGRTYNYAPVNYIQTPYERTNLFGELDFQLTDDVRLRAEARYGQRKSSQELAPQPYNSPTDPGYSGTFQQIDPLTGQPLREIPDVDADGNPVTYYTGDPSLGREVAPVAYNGISPDNFYNPFDFPITDARRRMVETTRRFEQNVDQLQVSFNLTGTIADTIDWEAYYNKGWQTQTFSDFGQFSGPRLFNAMGPSDDLDGDGSPECYRDISDESTLIANCVPFNFFGGPGSITQEMLDYVAVDLVDTLDVENSQLFLGFSGAFNMLEQSIGWSFGYEQQELEAQFITDSAKQLDEVTGNTGRGTRGARKSDSFIGELLVPVFDNGDQSLSMQIGARYDDFDLFGSNTTYQIGAELYIIPSLKFRATAGEVFRAPTLFELFAGQVDSFPQYLDPCDPTNNSNNQPAPGCSGPSTQQDTQVLARVGGNPFLEAEFGDTRTMGIVWTPDFGEGDFSLTVDYWKTTLEDVITNLGVQYILDDCYIDQNASSCNLVTRRANNSVAQILDAPINAASLLGRGVDTEIKYNFETEYGSIETSFLWARMIDRDRTAFAGDEVESLEARFTDPGESWVKDKVAYKVGWSMNDVSVSYLGEYIGGLDADVSFLGNYTQKVDSQLYHDLVLGYDMLDAGLRFAAGITNLTDEAPPYIDFGFNASTDPSTYRLFGRGYYLRMQWSPQS